MGLQLGDEIEWDVQGVPVAARVTSLREVNWGRFEPNFFAVFQSRALETAPKSFVLVAAVSSDTVIARIQRSVVTRYPNVSSVDLSLLRSTILQIIGRIALAVRFLALFSLAMAVPVLFSAVATSSPGGRVAVMYSLSNFTADSATVTGGAGAPYAGYTSGTVTVPTLGSIVQKG